MLYNSDRTIVLHCYKGAYNRLRKCHIEHELMLSVMHIYCQLMPQCQTNHCI